MIPPLSLKQPFQVQTESIRKVKTVIQTIMAIVFVIFLILGACFIYAPIPMRRAAHEIYYHPKYVTNQSSLDKLQVHILPYLDRTKTVSLKLTESSLKATDDYNNLVQYVQATTDFRDAGTVVECLKQTNRILNGSTLRHTQEHVLLFFDQLILSKEDLESQFYKNGGSASDVVYFHSLYEKFTSVHLHKITSNEKSVLTKIIPISSPIGKIPYELLELGFQMMDLVKRVQTNQIDPVGAAAYIHQAIMKIWPFELDTDGTARIWMNILLRLGGLETISMPADSYKLGMANDFYNPGIFTAYLATFLKHAKTHTSL